MANLPEMTKHKGFPSGMPSTGVQFTIRRANPKGVTPIKMIPRRARNDTKEHRIDAAFLHSLWHHFGAEPFERGNLARWCRRKRISIRFPIRRCLSLTSVSPGRTSRNPSRISSRFEGRRRHFS